MKQKNFALTVGAWALALSAAAVVAVLQIGRPQAPTAQNLTVGFNEGKPVVTPAVGRLLSLGYPRALSSLLWLRFLQYTPPERIPPGQRSWIYYDLLTISQLDPGFLPAYEMGAVFLSVITEDREGAEELLKRGVDLNPHNFNLLGALGYHYQFELKRPELAGPYFLRAAQEPRAPQIYAILASSYLSNTQSTAAAEAFLLGMAARNPDESFKKNIEAKIKRMREEGKR